MKADEMTLLINSAFSLVELIIRLQQANPNMTKDQAEKIVALRAKINELAEKPADYLQNWKG
jgi:hypothetical protein